MQIQKTETNNGRVAPPMTTDHSFQYDPSLIEEFQQMVLPMHMPAGIQSMERDEERIYPEIVEYQATSSSY